MPLGSPLEDVNCTSNALSKKTEDLRGLVERRSSCQFMMHWFRNSIGLLKLGSHVSGQTLSFSWMKSRGRSPILELTLRRNPLEILLREEQSKETFRKKANGRQLVLYPGIMWTVPMHRGKLIERVTHAHPSVVPACRA